MLKKIGFILLLIVLLAGGYFLSIMMSTGFFRTIDSKPYGKIYQEISLAGAEDMTIDYENDLMIVSAFDRAGEVRDENPMGGLFLINLKEQPFELVKLSDELGDGFHPHGISLYKKDSSSYLLWVVNHQKGKHTIEKFELSNNRLKHLVTYENETIISPNDVVAVDEHRFYFTNDHGNTSKLGILAENYLGLAESNVGYFDGKDFSIAAEGIQYANGINISPNKKNLYVASPRAFMLKTYSIEPSGRLISLDDIPVGTGIDNLEWDDSGTLWSGAHPNLLRFSAYAKLKKETSPSEIVGVRNGQVSSHFMDQGSLISGSSVAVWYEDYLFIGTVMDDKILVLKE